MWGKDKKESEGDTQEQNSKGNSTKYPVKRMHVCIRVGIPRDSFKLIIGSRDSVGIV